MVVKWVWDQNAVSLDKTVLFVEPNLQSRLNHPAIFKVSSISKSQQFCWFLWDFPFHHFVDGWKWFSPIHDDGLKKWIKMPKRSHRKRLTPPRRRPRKRKGVAAPKKKKVKIIFPSSSFFLSLFLKLFCLLRLWLSPLLRGRAASQKAQVRTTRAAFEAKIQAHATGDGWPI